MLNNDDIDKLMQLFAEGKKVYNNQKDLLPQEESSLIRCYIKKHSMWTLINQNLTCLTKLVENQLIVTEEELKNSFTFGAFKKSTQTLELLINQNFNCLTKLVENQLIVSEEELKNSLRWCLKRDKQTLDLLFLEEKEKAIEEDVVEIVDKEQKKPLKKSEEQEKKQSQDLNSTLKLKKKNKRAKKRAKQKRKLNETEHNTTTESALSVICKDVSTNVNRKEEKEIEDTKKIDGFFKRNRQFFKQLKKLIKKIHKTLYYLF